MKNEKDILIKEIMKLRKDTIRLSDEYVKTIGHLHESTSVRGHSRIMYRRIREQQQKEEYAKFKFPMLVEALKEHTRLNMVAKMKAHTVKTYAKESKKIARGKK